MYSLDVIEARKADSQGNQIKEIGKYVGTITQAEDITAKTGTKGIAISFTSNAGQKAKLSIYTMKADGSKIGGFSTLNAIMTCLQLRNIAPKPGKVTSYDYDTKTDVVKDGQVFPELCKPIGLLLETKDFAKQDGGTGTRMVVRGVFQHNTELTASEILDRKTTPEALPKMVAALRHHPLKAAKAMPTRQHGSAMPDDQFFAEDDDQSIPF
jgi:hypothetical protein